MEGGREGGMEGGREEARRVSKLHMTPSSPHKTNSAEEGLHVGRASVIDRLVERSLPLLLGTDLLQSRHRMLAWAGHA